MGLPDSLGSDLYRYLVDHIHGELPEKRRRCGWVMNTEWNNECRKLAGELGYAPELRPRKPEYMLGLPILAIHDAGGRPAP